MNSVHARGDSVAGVLPGRQSAAIRQAAHLLQFVEERTEDIRVVVRDARVGKVREAFGPLDDAGDALEAHAGIDVPGGEGGEGAVGVGVKLDEDEVPNLDAGRRALVNQAATGVARWGEIDVQLGARSARAGLAHHPEVVFFVAVDDVDGGVEPRGGEARGPVAPRFLVTFRRVAECGIGLVDGGV